MVPRNTARVKKKAVEEARIVVYIDEAGFNLMPSSGHTWSLVGPTPILETGCRYQHLSMISAVMETGGCYYALQEKSFTGATVTDFLRDLSHQIDYPLVVVWDHASSHRAAEVKTFLSQENTVNFIQSLDNHPPTPLLRRGRIWLNLIALHRHPQTTSPHRFTTHLHSNQSTSHRRRRTTTSRPRTRQ